MESSGDRDAKTRRLDFSRVLLLIILGVGLWLGFMLIRPFADAIIIAGVLAVLLNPVYRRLLGPLRGHRTTAALLTSLVTTIVLAAISVAVVWKLTVQMIAMGQETLTWAESGGLEKFMNDPTIVKLSQKVNYYMAEVNALTSGKQNGGDVNQLRQLLSGGVSAIPERAMNFAGGLVGAGTSIILDFLVIFMIMLFLLRDQDSFRSVVYRTLPFTWGHEESISRKVATICRSTVAGVFIAAIIQGASVGIAFWISGLPAVVGGVATAISALIPLIGTGLVWIPATAYLLVSGQIGYAIFITVWWVLAVAPIDNILRPILVGEGAQMSTPLIFLFILGGISVFGVMGLIYGPLALGLLRLLLHLYRLEMGLPEDEEAEKSG